MSTICLADAPAKHRSRLKLPRNGVGGSFKSAAKTGVGDGNYHFDVMSANGTFGEFPWQSCRIACGSPDIESAPKP